MPPRWPKIARKRQRVLDPEVCDFPHPGPVSWDLLANCQTLEVGEFVPRRNLGFGCLLDKDSIGQNRTDRA